MGSIFLCEKCGLCCQNLDKSDIYNDLNDGTGVCIYFEKETKLCTIYDNRPAKCNVMAFYQYVKNDISLEDYLKMNYESCRRLKGER